jgi:hypothetical protein
MQLRLPWHCQSSSTARPMTLSATARWLGSTSCICMIQYAEVSIILESVGVASMAMYGYANGSELVQCFAFKYMCARVKGQVVKSQTGQTHRASREKGNQGDGSGLQCTALTGTPPAQGNLCYLPTSARPQGHKHQGVSPPELQRLKRLGTAARANNRAGSGRLIGGPYSQ